MEKPLSQVHPLDLVRNRVSSSNKTHIRYENAQPRVSVS